MSSTDPSSPAAWAARLLAGAKAAMKAGGIGLLLIGGCGLSLAGLYALDRLRDPHETVVRNQIDYARQNLQLRQCLEQDPWVLDVSAAASAPPRQLRAVSLGEFAASAPAFSAADAQLQQRLERCRSVWASTPAAKPDLWLRAHLLEPGSSLNVALRLLRLLAIGLLAACSIELLLRLLSWARLPVASFKDIAKAHEEKSPSALPSPASAFHLPTPPLGLARMIGTTLVTSVTGFSVLGPELLHQISSREHERELTYIERAVPPDDSRTAGALQQANLRLDALQQRLEVLLHRPPAEGPLSAQQWQALEQLAEKGIAPVRTVADPKGLDDVRQSLAEVRQAVQAVKPAIDTSLASQLGQFDQQARERSETLARGLADASDRAKGQLDDLARLAQQTRTTASEADRRAAGLLRYSGEIESKRWFFRDEANYRYCIVLLADNNMTSFNERCAKYASLLSLQPMAANQAGR